jgi:hypothetical protein
MTTRYNNGKIYKLVNSVDNQIYVGSTCSRLSKRLYLHKKKAIRKPNRRAYSHLNAIGWDNVRIILIEDCNVQTKNQLLAREQHYIDLLNPSLNKNSAIDDCPHNRKKAICKECGGSSICEHNKRKSTCKDCGGASICEHNRIKSKCKECGGASICEHNREKSHCKECGGASICKHNREKSKCKECGGASICEHNKQKSHCKECNGDKYYCYECEKSFGSKQALKRHENSKKHKAVYRAMFLDCFGEEP